MKKFTAIYTESVGSYGGAITKMIRFTQHDHEMIIQAMNRAGYESQQEGYEWDIASAAVFIFEGHPKLECNYEDNYCPPVTRQKIGKKWVDSLR